MNLIISCSIIILITSILSILIFILSFKMEKYTKNKSSKFECGFSPMSNAHPQFSIQFYLICLMFLILDIEVMLLIPLINSSIQSNYGMMSMVIFLTTLTIGLIHEWNNGALEWSK